MASQTKSVGAQRSAKAEAPALSTAAASCGSVSPSALKDKKTHALLKRVLALCKLFMVPDWRGHLRAKDKVTTNLTKALDGYSAECMANRKDDRLPILDRMREVVAGANELILNLKRQELPPWTSMSRCPVSRASCPTLAVRAATAGAASPRTSCS